jgi:hypothetical protein
MLPTAVALALSAVLLQACGGGGSDDSTAPVTGPPASSNRAPTITGAPGNQVQVGQAYSFTPAAGDADNDSLTFSISNKPTWASFNASTGTLSGTPTAANVGSFSDIRIGVSDGTTRTDLQTFTIVVIAAGSGAGSATLSWTPPTQRTDGSTLTNLAGYRIRYGNSPGNYNRSVTVSNASVSTYVIDSLSSGTYYFVVSAFDSAGGESDESSAVSKTIS